MTQAAEVLRELAQPSNAAANSTMRLLGEVEATAAKDDKEREENDRETLRRKADLEPVPARELGTGVQLTPWQVLHSLARAIALSRRGAGRGLAEHWGCLKYTQALTGAPGTFMALSAEGRDTAEYYKRTQSDELAMGFGLALARQVLARRHPDHSVSIVPADTALRAGWALAARDVTKKDPRRTVGYGYRPQFFAEVWKPGRLSRVLSIVCRGNHSGTSVSHTQLLSAAVHIEGVHIGGWADTPALVLSTELPVDAPLTVHALHAPGNGGKLAGPGVSPRDLDAALEEENFFPGIQPPAEGDETPELAPGIHVRSEHYAWLQHSLARTCAAGLAAFAGDAKVIARYLTQRQGKERYTGVAHAALGSVQDAQQTLLGIRFVGTDHVLRLNGTRVEAFSGVAADLFDHLAEGRLTQYRQAAHERRADWPADTWDPDWDGPVSIHPDGSVLAIRVLKP
ncbi:hypothetical protein ACIGXM_29695 [Kitasatospora sp. NPDC052896]|uniref:hypothetical protein n=1 Tax=Kitasatospora sp. NPDC052896 TaxID=3364061 RepID=UPI0037C6ADEA